MKHESKPEYVQEFIPFGDLYLLGIPYSRMHIYRLIKANIFPAPVRLGPGRVAFTREAIANYIADSKATPATYKLAKKSKKKAA
jgi:predicted DNA-binding transcriptional regulator AlpA